jgi:hypothetical protein
VGGRAAARVPRSQPAPEATFAPSLIKPPPPARDLMGAVRERMRSLGEQEGLVLFAQGGQVRGDDRGEPPADRGQPVQHLAPYALLAAGKDGGDELLLGQARLPQMTPSGPVKGYWGSRFSIVSWWPVPLGTPPARVETGRAGSVGEVPSRIRRGRLQKGLGGRMLVCRSSSVEGGRCRDAVPRHRALVRLGHWAALD